MGVSSIVGSLVTNWLVSTHKESPDEWITWVLHTSSDEGVQNITSLISM